MTIFPVSCTRPAGNCFTGGKCTLWRVCLLGVSSHQVSRSPNGWTPNRRKNLGSVSYFIHAVGVWCRIFHGINAVVIFGIQAKAEEYHQKTDFVSINWKKWVSTGKYSSYMDAWPSGIDGCCQYSSVVEVTAKLLLILRWKNKLPIQLSSSISTLENV